MKVPFAIASLIPKLPTTSPSHFRVYHCQMKPKLGEGCEASIALLPADHILSFHRLQDITAGDESWVLEKLGTPMREGNISQQLV